MSNTKFLPTRKRKRWDCGKTIYKDDGLYMLYRNNRKDRSKTKWGTTGVGDIW